MAASAQALTFSPASQGKTAQKQFIDGLAAQAKNGNKDAAFRLGLGYARGYFGLHVDFEKAREYFKIALKYNVDDTEINKSASSAAEKFCYDNREFLGEDLTCKELDGEKIVETGSYDVLHYVPSKFLHVVSVHDGNISDKIKQKMKDDEAFRETSHKNGAQRVKECSEKGFTPATGFLGVLLCEGYGLDKNVQEGLRLLKEAANAGNGESKFQLGKVFHMGLYDQKVDLQEAHKWYKAAKDQGVPGAETGLERVAKLKHGKCVLL
jgi:TPR repeat protein